MDVQEIDKLLKEHPEIEKFLQDRATSILTNKKIELVQQEREKNEKQKESLVDQRKKEQEELEARKTTIEDTFEKPFENFLPEDNWISKYTSIFKHSKYPLEFFFTTFMAGLLQVTHRKIKVLLEMDTYPIIFLTLLAESSKGKSPAVYFIKDVFSGNIEFMFGFNSTLGFISQLSDNEGNGLIIEEEYQRYFKSVNLIDLPDKLNDLYFAGELRNRIKKNEESFVIPKTYVNRIITLTPALFSKYTDADSKESGSIQRETFMFPIRFIKSDEEGIQKLSQDPLLGEIRAYVSILKQQILESARIYAEQHVQNSKDELPFVFDHQTEIDLIKYEEDFKETNKYDKDIIAAGGKIINKITSYALAFYLGDPTFKDTIENAQNLHIDTFIIPRLYYDCAIKFFEEYIMVYNLRAIQLIHEKVQFHPQANQYDKVHNFILQGGKEGVKLSKISKRFYGLDIMKILISLEQQDKIKAIPIVNGRGRPSTIYYALKNTDIDE